MDRAAYFEFIYESSTQR